MNLNIPIKLSKSQLVYSPTKGCLMSAVAYPGGASRVQATVVETRVGSPPQYFNIGTPLKSCNGESTPMMECIVQTYFVSNG